MLQLSRRLGRAWHGDTAAVSISKMLAVCLVMFLGPLENGTWPCLPSRLPRVLARFSSPFKIETNAERHFCVSCLYMWLCLRENHHVPSVEHTQFQCEFNGKNISFELSQVKLASNIENLSGGNHGIYIHHLCILVTMQDPNHLQQQKTVGLSSARTVVSVVTVAL